jgi:hypothetical protein
MIICAAVLLLAGCSSSGRSGSTRSSDPVTPRAGSASSPSRPATSANASAAAVVAGPPITSRHQACALEVTAIVHFAEDEERSGGTGGIPSLVPFLGVSSPLIQLAYVADYGRQRGAGAGTWGRVIERGCAEQKNPILSGPELIDVENVAVPADVSLLHRVKITR